jgi:hypothetical protein
MTERKGGACVASWLEAALFQSKISVECVLENDLDEEGGYRAYRADCFYVDVLGIGVCGFGGAGWRSGVRAV